MAYGLPTGTNITYGAPGFPAWVYSLAAAFNLQASTYPGHQESTRAESGFSPNPQRLNRGIDWTGSVADMQRFADYLLSIRSNLEQVIWQNPDTGQRVGGPEPGGGGADMSGGGIVGRTNTPTASVASGVWSLREQFRARRGEVWPPSPSASSWIYQRLTTATIEAQSEQQRIMTIPVIGSNNYQLETLSLPSPPYTFEINDSLWYGKLNSPTSFNSDYNYSTIGQPTLALVTRMRVTDNGTNRIIQYSTNNGSSWTTFNNSISRTDFITADQIGWGAGNWGTASRTLTLNSWSLT